MLNRLGTVAVLAIALFAIACGGEEEAAPDTSTTLSVVTSTTIVEDLVKQVGGDRVSATSIVPLNSDVHTFHLTPSDISKTAEADLLVIVGSSLSAVEELLAESAEGSVLELTHDMDLRPFPEALAHADEHGHEDEDDHEHEDEHEGEGHDEDENAHHDEDEGEGHDEDEHEHEGEDEDEHEDEHEHEGEDEDEHEDEHGHEDEDEHGHEDEDEHGHEDEDEHGHEDEDEHGHEGEDEHGHAHGEFDPHFWMDIDLTIQAVESIRDELSRLDPDGADHYAERADNFIAELRELDDEIREKLAGLPEERRYLVTFHDAYGYFADRYGLTILGFVVEGPEEEPSASAITELVESIEELGIPYIFSEPQFSARVIEQIARDTGTTVRRIPSGALAEEYPTYVEFLRAIANGIAE